MSTVGNKFAIFQYQFTSTVYWTLYASSLKFQELSKKCTVNLHDGDRLSYTQAEELSPAILYRSQQLYTAEQWLSCKKRSGGMLSPYLFLFLFLLRLFPSPPLPQSGSQITSLKSGPSQTAVSPTARRQTAAFEVTPMLPVCMARCYFMWKFMYSCEAFFRYLMWKFKMFMWHIGYNTWNLYVAKWLIHIVCRCCHHLRCHPPPCLAPPSPSMNFHIR